MYEAFFHLESRPFPSTPRIERYFPASTIEDAFRTLSRCVERAEGTGLVIGGPGTGKSLLCEMLAARFRDRFHVVKLDSAHLCTRRALLQNILFELKLPFRGVDEGGLRLSLIDFLEPGENSREGMLLVVDEAHTLPLRLVEEIRMITNLVRDGKSRARLVLAGDAAMEEHLANPKLVSLNQRVAARCYLQSLTYDETIEFVRSQISAVGGNPDLLFTDDALQAVFHASDGIPRLINQICDHALIQLANMQGRQLTATRIDQAWADLQQLPMPMSSEVETSQAGSSVVEFGSLDDSLLSEDEIDEDTDIFAEELDAEDPVAEDPVAEDPVAEQLDACEAEIAPEETECPAPVTPTSEIDLTGQLGVIEEHFQEIESFDASSACDEAALDARPIDAPPPHVEQLEMEVLEPGEVTAEEPCIEQPCTRDPSDPFAETFVHEEKVSDHYTALEASRRSRKNPSWHGSNRDAGSSLKEIFSPPDATEESLDNRTSPVEPEQFDGNASLGETAQIVETEPDVELPEPPLQESEMPALPVEVGSEKLDSVNTGPGVVKARVMRSVPPDDSDLLVVVDEHLESESQEGLPERTHRRRYRDMFTRLRESR